MIKDLKNYPIESHAAEELGWKPEIKDEDYHAMSAVSSGQVKTLNLSAYHWHLEHILGVEKARTPSMYLGSAIHDMILKGKENLPRYTVAPDVDRRTKFGKEEYAKWYSDLAPDAIAVSAKDHAIIQGIALAILKHPEASALLSDGTPECPGVFEHEGLIGKIKPDFVTNSGIMVDLKSALSANPKRFQYAASANGYDVQAAWYLLGGSKIVGKPMKSFKFIAVEKSSFAITIFNATNLTLEVGFRKIAIAIERLKHGIATDQWPAYATSEVELDPIKNDVYEYLGEIS